MIIRCLIHNNFFFIGVTTVAPGIILIKESNQKNVGDAIILFNLKIRLNSQKLALLTQQSQ